MNESSIFEKKNWKKLKNWMLPDNFPIALGLILSSVFALIFWVLNVSQNSEPIGLTALYRLYDYGYFPGINRFFGAFMGEYFLLDDYRSGILSSPIAGILPYSLIEVFIGNWAYVAGDVVAHCFRFLAFWLLMGQVASSRSEQSWGAFALMFTTSQYVMGDYTTPWIIKGVWGIRIPRDLVTSIYHVLSFWALLKLPDVLGQQKVSIKNLILGALPLVLLINGDVHMAISVTICYLIFILYWSSQNTIYFSQAIFFSIIGVILNIPLLIQTKYSNPFVMIRAGQFPVLDQLSLTTIASKSEIILLLGSFLFIGLLKAFKVSVNKRYLDLVLFAAVAYGFSMVASFLFTSLTGTNIQEYQFPFRKEQMAGFLVAVIGITILSLVLNLSSLSSDAYKKRFAFIAGGIGLLAFAISFLGFYKFSSEMASKTAQPEIMEGFGGALHSQWRSSAAELTNLLDKEVTNPIVVASFDHEFMFNLLLNEDIFTYLPNPQQSVVSDEELVFRFLNFCSILNLSTQVVSKLLQSPHNQMRYLFGGKYQFNRFYTYKNLDQYPQELLKSYSRRNNNWYLHTPDEEVEKLLRQYVEMQKGSFIFPRKYIEPKYIILNKAVNLGIQSVVGYQLHFQNASFAVFKR